MTDLRSRLLEIKAHLEMQDNVEHYMRWRMKKAMKLIESAIADMGDSTDREAVGGNDAILRSPAQLSDISVVEDAWEKWWEENYFSCDTKEYARRAFFAAWHWETKPASVSLEKCAKAICWYEHKDGEGVYNPERVYANRHAEYESLAEAVLDSINEQLKAQGAQIDVRD